MKKLIGAVFAAAVMTFGGIVCSAAKEEKTSPAADAGATFCFDTDAGISKWETFGSADSANLTMSITKDRKLSGSSLVIKEDFEDSLSSKFGGIRLSSQQFGMSSFQGCRFELDIYVEPAVKDHADEIKMFSDGKAWIEQIVDVEKQSWVHYTMTVPADQANNYFGIYIPITDSYSGSVACVDNLTIYDPSGDMIFNVGDYSPEQVKAETKGPSTFGYVMMIIFFIVLILGVLAALAYFVMRLIIRYR